MLLSDEGILLNSLLKFVLKTALHTKFVSMSIDLPKIVSFSFLSQYSTFYVFSLISSN
ncbi:Uncharacterised protein [Mycobacteroides abscessus subsp. abscessus]|nr:Uncharacterised protein [Mycobacteroides abscessus subsp. abscessus]